MSKGPFSKSDTEGQGEARGALSLHGQDRHPALRCPAGAAATGAETGSRRPGWQLQPQGLRTPRAQSSVTQQPTVSGLWSPVSQIPGEIG